VTWVGGLAWLDELVSQVLEVNLGGNGYPFSYTAKAAFVKPEIEGGRPMRRRRGPTAVTMSWTGTAGAAVQWSKPKPSRAVDRV